MFVFTLSGNAVSKSKLVLISDRLFLLDCYEEQHNIEEGIGNIDCLYSVNEDMLLSSAISFLSSFVSSTLLLLISMTSESLNPRW